MSRPSTHPHHSGEVCHGQDHTTVVIGFQGQDGERETSRTAGGGVFEYVLKGRVRHLASAPLLGVLTANLSPCGLLSPSVGRVLLWPP